MKYPRKHSLLYLNWTDTIPRQMKATDNTGQNQSAHAIFTRYLHSKKMRKTPERFAILDRVAATDEHFSIEDFYDGIESKGFHVSRATVYNTIQLLVDCGLVRCHRFGNSSSKYEFVEAGTSHHHLICTKCGRIREVKDPDIAKVLKAKRYSTFNTSYFSLYVYGICSRCSRKARTQKANLK